MTKTAPSPTSPYEAELSTNNFQGSIIVFCVVKREIANLVLNLKRLNYIENFGGGIGPCMLGADFREPNHNLARLAIFVSEEAADAI